VGQRILQLILSRYQTTKAKIEPREQETELHIEDINLCGSNSMLEQRRPEQHENELLLKVIRQAKNRWPK